VGALVVAAAEPNGTVLTGDEADVKARRRSTGGNGVMALVAVEARVVVMHCGSERAVRAV
jgi:hypothetical protein